VGTGEREQLYLVGVAAVSLLFALVFILIAAVVKESLLFAPLLLFPIISVIVIIVLLKHVSIGCSSTNSDKLTAYVV
jgi:apolipoprotein N-acyltransferase